MKLKFAGILALSVLSAGPVLAQATDSNGTASDVDISREQLRRETQRQILMENASREQRRVIQMQRLRDAGSNRRQMPRPPESAPANTQSGTVRTQ